MRSTVLRGATALLFVFASLAGASVAHATVYVTGALALSGLNEVPTNASTATGTGYVVVNTATNVLYYDITYSGLSSAETAAHIHGFSAVGVNSGVLTPLPAGTHKVGTWVYPEADEANILNGLTYINIHSVNFSGGEIRAQINGLTVSVPSTTPWGLVALSLLLAASAAFILLRRRARNLA